MVWYEWQEPLDVSRISVFFSDRTEALVPSPPLAARASLPGSDMKIRRYCVLSIDQSWNVKEKMNSKNVGGGRYLYLSSWNVKNNLQLSTFKFPKYKNRILPPPPQGLHFGSKKSGKTVYFLTEVKTWSPRITTPIPTTTYTLPLNQYALWLRRREGHRRVKNAHRNCHLKGGGGGIGKGNKKCPKSTLFADNTWGLLTTKQTKPRPVASAASNHITPGQVRGDCGRVYSNKKVSQHYKKCPTTIPIHLNQLCLNIKNTPPPPHLNQGIRGTLHLSLLQLYQD